MPTVTERSRTLLPADFDPNVLPRSAANYVTILRIGRDTYAETGPYIGRLPLLDGTEMTFAPKVEIQDLGYLILRSEHADRALLQEFNSNVSVGSALSQLDSLYSIYATRFLSAVEGIRQLGPLREREEQVHLRGERGRPHIPTYRRNLAKTLGLRMPTVSVNSRVDNAVNRFARYVCQYLAASTLPQVGLREMAAELATYLRGHGIGEMSDRDLDEAEHLHATERLPASRPYYHDVLEAGFLILHHVGFNLHAEKRFETTPFIVNMEKVFEDYIRELVKEAAKSVSSDLAVFPGRADPRNLYLEGGPLLEPDVLVRRGGAYPVILDVKYKDAIDLGPDDHYQVMAYTNSYNAVKHTVLVTAYSRESPGLRYTTPRSQHPVTVLPFNLADTRKAEQNLLRKLNTLLS
ncbi:5-methylcytosine restriction system specificity protein McrC [Deinococcus sp. A31D244]|uniref:5-methylcytosine restriction system specificity protein McrC n=1 Tax=Deinococcus sp. A31D244 TaxID=3397675 RepID=UPI0039E084AC